MRFFTTEGPVNPKDHYCLHPLERIDLKEVLSLIAQKKYFLLHAPRQTGKTTCLLALMEHLNQEGTYRALYVNIEGAQAARENVEQGIAPVLKRRSLPAAALSTSRRSRCGWGILPNRMSLRSCINTRKKPARYLKPKPAPASGIIPAASPGW